MEVRLLLPNELPAGAELRHALACNDQGTRLVLDLDYAMTPCVEHRCADCACGGYAYFWVYFPAGNRGWSADAEQSTSELSPLLPPRSVVI